MKKGNIFIVIPTFSIGGSEKRIIGFWLYANEKFGFKIKLVIRKELYDLIKNVNELKRIENFKELIIFENIDYLHITEYTKSVNRIIKKYVQSEDIVHFISSFPYLKSIRQKTVFSFTESSLNNVNYKGKVVYYLSFLRANKIDVLDPIVFNGLKINPLFKKKINLTPNSFVDPNLSLNIDYFKKGNRIIHLGRFHKGKYIDKFITALPVIDALLIENGILDTEYLIIGSGALESEFKQILSNNEYSNINYKIFFTENPYEYLKSGKIILSIQEFNNYPSKSLLEGIICGNIPLVTDVGTTRKIAQQEFSYFLNKSFSASDLAMNILEILQLNDKTFRVKTELGIEYIKNNFSIEKMAEYYFNLYKI